MKTLFCRGPRYLAVSLFCMLLSNAILIGVCLLGFSSGVAVLTSAAILIPVGFLLQARFTFAHQPDFAAFIRYAGALALNVPLSWLVLVVARDVIGLDIQWAASITTISLFLWNALASHWALDRQSARLTRGIA